MFLGPPTLVVNFQNYNIHDKQILFKINGDVKLSTLKLLRDICSLQRTENVVLAQCFHPIYHKCMGSVVLGFF